MNKASVDGKTIDDGDYVLVDTEDKNAKSGDYVLSIINGMANIKKYAEDTQNRQIILSSESKNYFPPIYIHEDDDYLINGKVVDVLKKPNKDDEFSYEPVP